MTVLLTLRIYIAFWGGRFSMCLPFPHFAVSIRHAEVQAEKICGSCECGLRAEMVGTSYHGGHNQVVFQANEPDEFCPRDDPERDTDESHRRESTDTDNHLVCYVFLCHLGKLLRGYLGKPIHDSRFGRLTMEQDRN